MSKQPISWQDALQSFLDANPTLPDGQELPQQQTPEPKAGRVDIIYEKKGRAGKPATIISGFEADYPEDKITNLASEMKRAMGCGGSARGGEILLQGDRRSSALDFLERKGIKARII